MDIGWFFSFKLFSFYFFVKTVFSNENIKIERRKTWKRNYIEHVHKESQIIGNHLNWNLFWVFLTLFIFYLVWIYGLDLLIILECFCSNLFLFLFNSWVFCWIELHSISINFFGGLNLPLSLCLLFMTGLNCNPML